MLSNSDAMKKMDKLMADFFPTCRYYTVTHEYRRHSHEKPDSGRSLVCTLYADMMSIYEGECWEKCFALLEKDMIANGKLPF